MTDPEGAELSRQSGIRHWMDFARMGIRIARQGIEESGKSCAVAFCINGDVNSRLKLERFHLVKQVFEEDPPDIILMETISLVREHLTLPAVEALVETGIPVWLSFRRCREGLCGIHGQLWGGPEGDYFGRVSRRFEEMGIRAILINCLPVSRVPGTISWLRDFTDLPLPLGVYPNLGRYLDPGWKFDDLTGPEKYAEVALAWREEGAQIIGGCCGVTSEHLKAAKTKLEKTTPGSVQITYPRESVSAKESGYKVHEPWIDRSGSSVFPLPFPEIHADPGVFEPTQAAF